MTIEMTHKKSKAMVRISNNRYGETCRVDVTGDWFLEEYFDAYFNKQLTDEWSLGDSIPDKFKLDGKLLKHEDAFLLSYFIPLYEDVYEIRLDEAKD